LGEKKVKKKKTMAKLKLDAIMSLRAIDKKRASEISASAIESDEDEENSSVRKSGNLQNFEFDAAKVNAELKSNS
jgi:hypothetical protein